VDWKENVSVRTVPALFLAIALKARVCPSSSDAFGDGLSVMLAGTWFVTTWVALPPPQPERKIELRHRHASAAEADLADLYITVCGSLRAIPFSKILSVEVDCVFGNFITH